MHVINKNPWICVRSVNFVISKIKDWLTFAGGIYQQQLLLVCVPSLFSFSHFICIGGSLIYDFWVLSNRISSFDGAIAVLVTKHSNQRSQLFQFGHQDYLQQSHRAENTLVKICNMAAILFLWFLVLVSVVLGDEIGNWKKYGKSKFLVQFSKGERVSVTSLFLKERLSNFCFLASGSSSLSFLSCPRSSTGDRVSVTVLFLALNSQISFLDVLWF